MAAACCRRDAGLPRSFPRSQAAAIYDPAADSWLEQPSMPDEYFPGIAVALTDGTALVVGGRRDGDTADTLRFIPPR